MKCVRVIRRSISILLVSVMILALMPASVFAYDYVAKIEYSNGDLASYKTFENAWINLRDKCTLTLLKDCNVNDLLSIPDNTGTVSIDMDGYAIDRQLDSGKSNGEVINIGLNNTITINNGVITGGNSTDDGGGILLSGSGITLNLIKTHITGNKAEDGGGICLKGKNNTMYLSNGSSIDGNTAKSRGGGLYIKSNANTVDLKDSSTIKNNSSDDDGGGIFIDGQFNSVKMKSDCSIDSNTAYDKAGGIYINNENNTLSGGSVTNNKNTGKGYGGGIYINYGYTMLENMTISQNSSSKDGGGVYLYSKQNLITGCTIKDNTAIHEGGGIYDNKSENSLTACTVTGNTAGDYGGGIFVSSVDNIDLSGITIIKDNTADKKNDNLYLNSGSVSSAYFSGVPSKGSEIHIHTYYLMNPKCQLSANAGTYDESMFVSDIGHVIYWNWDQNNGTGDRILYEDKTSPVSRSKAETDEIDVTAEDSVSGRKTITENGYTFNNNSYDMIRGVVSFPLMEDSTTDADSVYYYSDGYFADAPENYNTSLATMSLCLAISAFGANAGNAADPTDYTNKFAHVKQLLCDIGCKDEDVYISNTFTKKPETDSIAFAIAKKQITIGNDSYTLVPIAIRGSGYEREWASNATVGETGEEEGFSEAAYKVFSQVQQYIREYGLSEAAANGKVKFWVVGFSRAGATANLTSARLTGRYGESGNKIYGYDFEAPKGGTDADAIIEKWTDNGEFKNIHNIINAQDIVPLVAPSQMGFKRYGIDHYVPGDAASDIRETASSPLCRADNSATDVKKQNSSDYDPVYIGMRSLMLTQLAAVSPDTVFDDYFRVATFDYFWNSVKGKIFSDVSLLSEVSDDRSISAAQWESDFIAYFQKWALNGQSSGKSYREYMATEKINGYTFQDAVRTLFDILYGKSAQDTTHLMNVINSNVQRLSFGNTWSIYRQDIMNWSTLSDKEKNDDIEKLWKLIMKSDGQSNNISSLLTAKEYNNLKAICPTLLSVILKFINTDYSTKITGYSTTQILAGTLAYNSGSILQAHNPEVTLAWLRSFDTNYMTKEKAVETKQVKLVNKSSFNVQTPVASVTEENSSATGTPVSGTDTTYLGNHDIHLSSNTGSAIYYTLTTTVDGGTSDTSSLQLYQQKIPLSACELKTTKYEITTYAMAFGQKSESKTYTYTIHNDRYVLTTITRDTDGKDVKELHTYSVGDTVSINANATANKTFASWKITSDSSKEETYTPKDNTYDEKSAITSFTMPEQDLTATASYKDKITSIVLTITAPADGVDLQSEIPESGIKLNGTTYKDLAAAIVWTADGKPVSGKADYSTAYTANVTLNKNEADGIVFGDPVSTAVKYSDSDTNQYDATIYRNDADGSVIVSYTFEPTGKAKLKKISDLSPVSVPNGTPKQTIIDNYLPKQAELITEKENIYQDITWTDFTITEDSTEKQNVTVKGTLTCPDDIDQNSVSLDVTVSLTVEAAAKAASPSADLMSGTYIASNKDISLSSSDGGYIYYTMTETSDGNEPADPGNPTAESTQYSSPIKITADPGYITKVKIKAIAVAVGKSESEIAGFTYIVQAPPSPHTLTVSYKDTNMGISLTDPVTLTYNAGDTVVLAARPFTDEKFSAWASENETIIKNPSDKNLSFTMPDSDVSLVAGYIPVVSKVEVTIDEPKYNTALAVSVNECKVTVTNTYTVSPDALSVTWTPAPMGTGKANFNTVYTVRVANNSSEKGSVITDGKGETHEISGEFTYADKVTCTVNGNPASLDKSDNSVVYTFPKTNAPELLSIYNPEAISLEHGSSITLPKTVDVEVEDHSITRANVTWDNSCYASYDANKTTSQTFFVTGVVSLPDTVSNTLNLSAAVFVNVADAETVETPEADPDSGIEFTDSLSVNLTCDTDSATIYYTTDGTEPSESSQKYSGPITISDTTTIRTCAVKDGMLTSDTAIFSYYKDILGVGDQGAVFTINSLQGKSRMIDIAGRGTENQVNADIYAANETPAQRFLFTYTKDATGGYYTITNVFSGKVLEAQYGGTSDGTNIWQYASNGTDAQKWIITMSDTDGYYYIVNKASGLVFDIAGGNTANGANLQLYTLNKTAAQKFRFNTCENETIDSGDSYSLISALSSDKAADIGGASKESRAALQLYTANGTGAQVFVIEYDGKTGYYSISNKNSGLLLDVSGGSLSDKAIVWQYTSNDTMAQRWSIKTNADGSYSFYCANSGKVLDVPYANTADSTKLWQFQWNGSPAQKWELKKV